MHDTHAILILAFSAERRALEMSFESNIALRLSTFVDNVILLF